MLLAGGQSLVPMMNFRLAAPDMLIDLAGIEELKGISVDAQHVRIGAMTRYCELATDPLIAAHVPLLTKALPHIAHAAIRNRGTIGGSVALADPAAEMPALLMALDAQIELTSQAGRRVVAAADFFVGVYETILDEGELVTAINCPMVQPDQKFGFYELTRRHGDYAMAGVAISASSVAPITNLRIVFFGVSDVAVRATSAERLLNGSTGSSPDITAARDALSELAFEGDLNADATTKQHLAGVVLGRALQEMLDE
jgi:carbon-monoxide dehydrogenase medium subunit